MIESFRTWRLLLQLRAHVSASPRQLRTLQDSLFREALLHAYHHVPFYRRYWDDAGFNPHEVRGTQDLEQVPIMTPSMARSAAENGELLASNLDVAPRTFIYTTGSSGHPMCLIKGKGEERLWRAQGLRIWMEHGYHWRDTKAQFNEQTGSRHVLQQLGISRTRWINPIVPLEDLRHHFLEAKADWIIATPTVLRRLAIAVAGAGGEFRPLRGIFCQGELLDLHTRDVIRRTFGILPVNVYASSELGYMAWQCERREGLHINADTHIVEVLDKGVTVRSGALGSLVVTDLRNRAMPFLRYETGDLAISGNTQCGCGRQFPSLPSIEGRQRDAVHLKHGRLVTARCLIDHLGQLLPVDGFRLYQESTVSFRLEIFHSDTLNGHAGTPEAPCPPNRHVLEKHLQALLGDVEIEIQTVESAGRSGEKTNPIVVSSPAQYV